MNVTFPIIMSGGGHQQFTAPRGVKFLSVINNSDNTLEIYQDLRTALDSNIRDTFMRVSPYSAITLPLTENRLEFTVIYVNGGGLGVKAASLIFSDVNLNINTTFTPVGSNTNVNLVTDSVGLAKGAQLPAALTASGNLKTEILNTVPVTVSGNVEVMNDTGNPLPVSGTVEVTNDVGNPLPISITQRTVIGTQGNAWNAANVGANGNSAAIDAQYMQHLAAFGNSSIAGDIKVFASQDNVNWYDTGVKQTLAAAGNFYIKMDAFAARYVRLQSSVAATITATIAGKG